MKMLFPVLNFNFRQKARGEKRRFQAEGEWRKTRFPAEG